MTFDQLRTLLDDRKSLAIVVGDYQPPYGVGLTMVNGTPGFYFRAQDLGGGVTSVTLENELVPVLIEGDPSPTVPASGERASPAPFGQRLKWGLEKIKRDIDRAVADLFSIPERERQEPLVCGLEIQNRDTKTWGSIGCFVTLGDGSRAMLSAAHVLAGANGGVRGVDRIHQPSQRPSPDNQPLDRQVATLTDFVPLEASDAAARPHTSGVTFNTIDAGVATLAPGVTISQAYLPARPPLVLNGTAAPVLNDRVLKVGRTTGPTSGVVKAVSHTLAVGIEGLNGLVWFRDTFVIEPDGGKWFGFDGDSGALVVSSSTGKAVGMLIAIDGPRGIACPIESVFAALGCRL
jgi:hypothetical protein